MRAAHSKSNRFLSIRFTDVSLLTWLRAVWLVVVFWFEFGLFYYSVASCGWGDKQLSRSPATPTHVLLVSDPQVRDASPRKHGLLSRLQLWLYHAGLRKNWKYAKQLKPDTVVFLGDILASGRKIKDDEEYAQAVERFRDLFSLDRGMDAYYVPGNEDVGLNLMTDSALQARDHFVQHFGSANQHPSIGDHTFVFLDSPLLVEEDYHRAKLNKGYDEWRADADGTVEFVRSFKEIERRQHRQPIVLFTHIPLDRPDVASCGPLREQGTIRKGAGPGYQNMLGKLTTQFIFENIGPSIVFSGDDRDYCDYTHMFTQVAEHGSSVAFIREVTVKSFSTYKHIKKPGFHLLSLVPPYGAAEPLMGSEPHTYTDSPCLLPSQSAIYTSVYLPLSLLTLAIVLIASMRPTSLRYQPLLPSHSPLLKTHSPPRGVTHRSQHEKGHESTSVFFSPDTSNSSLSFPPRHDDNVSLPWLFHPHSDTSPSKRSRHSRKPSSIRKEIEVSSRTSWSRIFRIRRLWHVFRSAVFNFFLAILPSLAMWIFITWWTLL